MSLDITIYDVELELTSDMLGTVPKSKSIYVDFIASKSRKKMKREGLSDSEIDEKLAATVEGIEDQEESNIGHTTFLSDRKGPFLSQHQIKGFLKESARTLKEADGKKQLRDKVARYVAVSPDKIRLPKFGGSDAGEWDVCVRPLRAQTPQGERIAIARSDTVEAGTILSFQIKVLNNEITKNTLKDILTYGEHFIGLMQFRSGGYGRFKLKKLSVAE